MKKECIFCKKYLHENSLYENKYFFCIKDINPKNNTHLLFITKKHYDYINDLSDTKIKDLFIYIKKALKYFNIYRFQIITNNIFNQDIDHMHLHVLSQDNILINKDELNDGMLLLSNTETVPGIFWKENDDIAKKEMLKIKSRDSNKLNQLITNDFEASLRKWQIDKSFFDDKKNELNDWFNCKSTIIINQIGIKFTQNAELSPFLNRYKFLHGTSLNISGKPPLFGNKLKLFLKMLSKQYNILNKISNYSNKNNKSSNVIKLG